MDKGNSQDRVLKAAFACQPALVSYAHALLQDYAAAEDVVQNALLVVIKKHNEFQEGTSMLGWCRAIVRLEVLRQLRQRQRERPIEDRILHDAVDTAFEEFQSDKECVKHEQLRKCLARLPKRGRETLQLRYAEDMGYEAIGNTLGMTIEAVRKALFRLKRQLRSCLERNAEALG